MKFRARTIELSWAGTNPVCVLLVRSDKLF